MGKAPGRAAWSAALGLAAAVLVSVGGGADSGVAEGRTEVPGWNEWVSPAVEPEDERGLAFFPAHLDGGRLLAVRDPATFLVRFVTSNRPGEERVVPAGVAEPPPPGRWHFWIESDWEISSFSELAVFPRPTRWRVAQPRFLQAEVGGRIREPADSRHLELWALHAELPGPDGPFGRVARRRPVDELAEGMLMPAGWTLAALWNPAEEQYEAVSRPFEVDPGRHVAPAYLRPSEGKAFLLVEVAHPLRIRGDDEDRPAIEAQQGETRLPPDEWVETAEASYGLWYALAPGPVRVSGGGRVSYFPATEMVLKDGSIGHLAEALVPRPLLDVTLVLPPELKTGPLSLAVFRTEGGEELAAADLGPRQSRHRFHLVHDEVTVELRSDFGTYRRVVDLTDETEASVLIEPDIIRLTGELRHGGEPAEARIRLHTTDGHRLQVETDEDGWFEVLALRPVYWGAVFLEDEEDGEPWMETWMPPISEDRHLEIDIADVDFTVRVVDTLSGLPIPEARVDVESHYRPQGDSRTDREEDEDGPEQMMAKGFTADEEGRVRLPPPRPGRLEIQVKADRYHPAPDPVVVTVPDPPMDREIVLSLQPIGPGERIQLRLPDGRPAAGAELLAVRDLSGAAPSLPLRAGPGGEVEIPVDAGVTHLLVRHPEAASRVVAWPPPAGGGGQWTLEQAAPVPLRLHVAEPEGEAPRARATPILWIDGVSVSGPLLRWLFDAQPFIGPRGYWSASRLPPRPLRVLVAEHSSQHRLKAYPNLATEVAYPWPSVVELEIVR